MSQDAVETARRTLTSPRHARLLVDGLGPAGATQLGIELIDRHGTPVLLCDPGSPVTEAAGRGRCATLSLGTDPEVAHEAAHERVVFRGQLRPAGRDLVEDREVELVELHLLQVSVRASGDAAPVSVPLKEYHASREPELLRYAATVQRHTNASHESELREFVTALSGIDDDLVAGARLSAVDPQGITVQWVDLDGAHEVRVLFPRRAVSCQHLGELLSQALCQHC